MASNASGDIISDSSRRPRGSGAWKRAEKGGVALNGDCVGEGNMCRSSLARGIDRRCSNDPQRGVGLDQTPLRVATTSRFGTDATLALRAVDAQPTWSAMNVLGSSVRRGEFPVEQGQPGMVTAEILVDPPHQQAQRGGRVELGRDVGGHACTRSDPL